MKGDDVISHVSYKNHLYLRSFQPEKNETDSYQLKAMTYGYTLTYDLLYLYLPRKLEIC